MSVGSGGRLPAPRKHVWIELIAFDVEAPDLGVAAVIEGMGDRPERLSLLLYSAEFLHAHDDLGAGLLPRECTSYHAREWSVRGPRQDWTRADLRRLVLILRERGIDTYFAVFDMFTYDAGGGTIAHSAWARRHPEMHLVDDEGNTRGGLLNPLKRLADGRLYQEYIAERVAAVISYYGFAGFHGADGYSSGRLPLWRVDFSDEVITQFGDRTGIRLGDLAPSERAETIRRSYRREWIRFHAERWNELWAAICTAVHPLGARVMLNNAWTRDPLEALYRYGVDYRGLVAAGVDGFVLETVVAAVELLEGPPALPPLPGQLATVLLMSATLPRTPLSALLSVRDTLEEWDVIRVAPAMHERDVRELTAMRTSDEGGARPCVDAGLYCLSDGLDRRDWDWMDEVRRSAGPTLPPGRASITLVYDPDVIDTELDALIDGRAAHTHALLAALLRAGVDVAGVVAPAHVAAVPGMLLLLNPENYPDDVRAAVLDRPDGAVVLGRGPAADTWDLAIRRGGRIVSASSVPAARGVPDAPEGHDSWVYELEMVMPPDELLAEVVAAVRGPVDALPPGVMSRERGSLDDELLVTFRNSTPWFQRVSYDAPGVISSATRLPGVSATPPGVQGSEVTTRVPPRGVATVRLRGDGTGGP